MAGAGVAPGSCSGSVRRGEEAAKPLCMHSSRQIGRERGSGGVSRAKKGRGSGERKRERGEERGRVGGREMPPEAAMAGWRRQQLEVRRRELLSHQFGFRIIVRKMMT